jgi:hypothetical protein
VGISNQDGPSLLVADPDACFIVIPDLRRLILEFGRASHRACHTPLDFTCHLSF